MRKGGLGGNDDGDFQVSSTEIAIGVDEGRVVMKFPEPKQWIALDPENCRLIAEAMSRAAEECATGRPAGVPGSPISDMTRLKLITRVTHIVRSMKDQHKAPQFIAAAIVDVILSEVL